MRCERIALPTEPYPHGRFTNSIIINTQKKCKHNYINRFTNFNCYDRIFFTWRHGSAGRAFASHARGHRFESCCLHQKKNAINLRSFFCKNTCYCDSNQKVAFGKRLRYAVCIIFKLIMSFTFFFVLTCSGRHLLHFLCHRLLLFHHDKQNVRYLYRT